MIIKQIKLTTADIMKQNLKLIQTFMYLFKFNLQIMHKSGKSHTVSDTFNQMLSFESMNINVNFLKFKSSDTFTKSIIIMSDKFKAQIKNVY